MKTLNLMKWWLCSGARVAWSLTAVTVSVLVGPLAARAQHDPGSDTNRVEGITMPNEPDEPDEAALESLPDSVEPPATTSPRERISIGAGLQVREDETVDEAVSVFGSSEVLGKVSRELVTVFGNATLSGSVNREMVTVFGKARMTGSVGREMVTVFGDAEVDGPVGRECVTVFGNLKLGPNARVGRECVAVFGSVERHPEAQLAEEPIPILPMFSGVGEWITDGLLLGRLIPPGSRLAWLVVALHLLLYGLIALLLPRPVKSCVEQLESRPLLTFGVGILTMILLVPLYLILAAIGVGIVLIPFIGLAETAFVCLGKTATLEAFGFKFLRGVGRQSTPAPLIGFLIGFVLVTLLYMVPILGLLVWMILRPVALGATVMACGAAMRKNGNGRAPAVPLSPVVPPPSLSPSPGTAPQGFAAEGSPTAGDVPPAQPGFTAPPIEVAVMPRAGFWIRGLATGLDFLALCWILFLPHVDSFFLFFWIAYHIGMWSWKGTTIGGVVCNLKVVRVDGREADVSVCVVRGLASVFSALPLLLGFFWVGWTRERQSWHDKIAGTVIVRVPKGLSLI